MTLIIPPTKTCHRDRVESRVSFSWDVRGFAWTILWILGVVTIDMKGTDHNAGAGFPRPNSQGPEFLYSPLNTYNE